MGLLIIFPEYNKDSLAMCGKMKVQARFFSLFLLIVCDAALESQVPHFIVNCDKLQ